MNKEPENCWEFMDCPEEIRNDCIVYQNGFGNECWLLLNSKRKCPEEDDFGNCLNCPWYKKSKTTT